ncbi:BnaC05g00150D [Brassica napus]|uniref:BnaC05g00150D protein n=1 Tax=Brassica napus TaxID=3708 RepID=A0A078FPV8_BRANA|nr:BnaC05g00150D [Brassica napus]
MMKLPRNGDKFVRWYLGYYYRGEKKVAA